MFINAFKVIQNAHRCSSGVSLVEQEGPWVILGFCCLNGLILCLLVTSKSCNIHNLHHRFLMKPTSVNCSKLSISQYKQRVMIWTSRYIQKQRCPGPKLICKTKPKVIVRLSSQIQHMMKRKRNFLVHPGKILKFWRSKVSKIATFYT